LNTQFSKEKIRRHVKAEIIAINDKVAFNKFVGD